MIYSSALPKGNMQILQTQEKKNDFFFIIVFTVLIETFFFCCCYYLWVGWVYFEFNLFLIILGFDFFN